VVADPPSPLDSKDVSRILLASTKYDGSLHYEFEADLVGSEGTLIRCVERAGTPWIGYRGEGRIRYDATALYFTDRWYNVSHFHAPSGPRGMELYVNVGMPAFLKNGVLRWVDLDIDIILDGSGVRVDDEDEFEEHRHRYAYPPELVERVLATRDEVLRLAEREAFPLDRQQHIPSLR
jgi:protein associated with RNAse G/E